MQTYYPKTVWTRLFDWINALVMLLLSFTILFPFWNQLCISLSNLKVYSMTDVVWLPLGLNTESYQMVLSDGRIGHAALVSVLRVAVGTVSTLFCTGLLAYITTIRWFSGHKLLRRVFLFTMYFGGGMIPTYLAYINIGLFNSFWVYIVPSLFSAYYMLLISSYLYGLPDALFEAARIDGATETRIYLKIVLPTCVPVFAAVSVYVAVNHWNAWFDTTLYVPSGNWDTLQVYLRRVLLEVEAFSKIEDATAAYAQFQALAPQSLRAAITILVTLPIVILYPLLQRYFISGITIGSVKA